MDAHRNHLRLHLRCAAYSWGNVMVTIDDGGPAFPVQPSAALSPITDFGGNDISSGMTLRDWFAGQALAGSVTLKGGWDSLEQLTASTYEVADAMLAARKPQP